MKKTITLVVLSLILTLNFACKKKDAAAAVSSGSDTTSKATLSSWHVANSAWSVRLDLNSANLNGTNFTLVYKYSDNSEVHCSNTQMTGQSDTGTFNITGSCTGPGTGSMADSGPTNFETVGVGSYSNDGTVLKLCLHSGSCISYY